MYCAIIVIIIIYLPAIPFTRITRCTGLTQLLPPRKTELSFVSPSAASSTSPRWLDLREKREETEMGTMEKHPGCECVAISSPSPHSLRLLSSPLPSFLLLQFGEGKGMAPHNARIIIQVRQRESGREWESESGEWRHSTIVAMDATSVKLDATRCCHVGIPPLLRVYKCVSIHEIVVVRVVEHVKFCLLSQKT